ncbi:MAG: TrkA family potassium uptake protein [Kouleothrix sp.]|nr:TrkA family potassium uptake protein [Kouleothrix sp.]
MRMIVIGCGRMGAGLAQALALRGHAVTVVDAAAEAFERLGPAFKGRTIVGVGFDRDVLLQAGIERADGLAAVTASDDANVVAARLARLVFRVPRVVARLYDPRKAEIYRRLGIQTISTTAWGINRITELLCYSRLDAISSLGSGEVDIVEAEISHLLDGRPIDALATPGEVQVVAISRAGHTFLPMPGAAFQEGDLVHMAVLASAIDRLKQALGLA